MTSEYGELILVDILNNGGFRLSQAQDRVGLTAEVARRVLDDLVGADLLRQERRPTDGSGTPMGPTVWVLTRTGERRAADLRRGDEPIP